MGSFIFAREIYNPLYEDKNKFSNYKEEIKMMTNNEKILMGGMLFETTIALYSIAQWSKTEKKLKRELQTEKMKTNLFELNWRLKDIVIEMREKKIEKLEKELEELKAAKAE